MGVEQSQAGASASKNSSEDMATKNTHHKASRGTWGTSRADLCSYPILDAALPADFHWGVSYFVPATTQVRNLGPIYRLTELLVNPRLTSLCKQLVWQLCFETVTRTGGIRKLSVPRDRGLGKWECAEGGWRERGKGWGYFYSRSSISSPSHPRRCIRRCSHRLVES